MKGLLLLGLCLALTACPSASGDNGPPHGVTASVLQAGDSVRIVIRWAPATVGQRQAPIAGYDTRLRQGASAILATGTTPAGQRVDTLRLVTPPLGVTIGNLVAEVRTRDTLGLTSSWTASSVFSFTVTPLPPNRPDSVQADTSIINQLAGLYIRPAIVDVPPGGTQQFCAIGLLWNGASGILGYERLTSEGQRICQEAYTRWLTERSS